MLAKRVIPCLDVHDGKVTRGVQFGVAEHDVHLITLPLFHSFGSTVQMNAGFSVGATLVLLPRFDAAKAVQDAKAGKLEYRTDRGANVHVAIGKKSFDERSLVENYAALVEEIVRAKPASSKPPCFSTLARARARNCSIVQSDLATPMTGAWRCPRRSIA